MPPRSKLTQLPAEVRKELDRRLLANGFSGYAELSKWLASQGCSITPQGLSSYGRRFEQRLQQIKLATEQARAIVEAAPDDNNKVNEALLRLIQQRLLEILTAVEAKQIKDVNLGALARIVGELGRAWVTQKKWLEETRARLALKVNAASAKVSEVARTGGITPETEERIRRALLEIQV